VAAQFNNQLQAWVPSLGVQQPVSTEVGVVQGKLMNEYRDLFRTYFVEVGDKDVAASLTIKRLGQKWGPTAVGTPFLRTRLMAYPPENLFPKIDGSHEWINEQLDTDVRAAAGNLGMMEYLDSDLYRTRPMELDLFVRSHRDPSESELKAYQKFSAPRALISDPQTELDIAARRPPSYGVIIQKDGRYEVLTDEKGAALRFRPDPNGIQKQKSDRDFQEARADRLNRPKVRPYDDLNSKVLGNGETPVEVPDAVGAVRDWVRNTPANPLKGFVPKRGKKGD
jgi:hypothetical protein